MRNVGHLIVVDLVASSFDTMELNIRSPILVAAGIIIQSSVFKEVVRALDIIGPPTG